MWQMQSSEKENIICVDSSIHTMDHIKLYGKFHWSKWVKAVLRRFFFCGSFMLFLFCFLLCFRARLFTDALVSPSGKRLTLGSLL